MVRMQLAVEAVEGIVDCVASALVVGKQLAKKLGVWKIALKVKISQRDDSYLSAENFIVNTSFEVFDVVSSPTSPTVVGKFSLYAEVLHIENEECILCWS